MAQRKRDGNGAKTAKPSRRATKKNDAAAAVDLEAIVAAYRERHREIEWWGRSVFTAFELEESIRPFVHSLRFRMKDEARLRSKVEEKLRIDTCSVTRDNLFAAVTDLAGIRVLQLRKADLQPVHRFIVESQRWKVLEPPVAYNVDDRFRAGLDQIGLKVERREDYYTSVHYLVGHTDLACEIQVRTLFEEIWGELNHPYYAEEVSNPICQRNLETLNGLCSLGALLVEDLRFFSEETDKWNAERTALRAEKDTLLAKLNVVSKELDELKKQPAATRDVTKAAGLLNEITGAVGKYSTALESATALSSTTHYNPFSPAGIVGGIWNPARSTVEASPKGNFVVNSANCAICDRLLFTSSSKCPRCGAPICDWHQAGLMSMVQTQQCKKCQLGL